MLCADVIVPDAECDLVAGDSAVSLAVPEASVALDVPGTGSVDVVVPDATVALQVGSLNEMTVPRLLECTLTASPGVNRVAVEDSVWSHAGAIRYSCRRVSDGSRFATSSYSAVGTSAALVACIGLTIGTAYELDYWLDCQPDVTGYGEQWIATGVIWTQPASLDPEVEFYREQG